MEPTTTWEEKIYWGHFSTFHFAQFLLTGFETQLDIPEKFTNNLKHKLPPTVTLRGPTGVTWSVELVTTGDDTLAFKQGWKQFVSDNFLMENDFLIFKYNGESQFEVLMFDAHSLCEKVATYFVREPSNQVVLSPSPEQPDDDDGFMMPPELKFPDQSGKKERPESLPVRRGSRIRRPTLAATKMNNGGNSGDEQSNAKRRKASNTKSKRRPVTEEEIGKALEAAKAEASDDSAIIVVGKNSHVAVQTDWLGERAGLEDQDVELRCGDKTWRVRFNRVKYRGTGGFGAGWKKFVVDNGLEECDVCLFRLAPGSDTPVVLDVSIFRVVEDTTTPPV